MAIYDPPRCNSCGFLVSVRVPYCTSHPTDQVMTMTFADDDERPSWDETWLAVADVIAKRSRCERAQVGAVIVAEDQTVISASYNGPPKGYPMPYYDSTCSDFCPRRNTDDPSPTYDDCPSVHAEANAIARADFSRMKGSTVYVSTSCCKGCAKLLANSGVKRVVFRHEDGKDYRNPEATIEFLRECGIEVDEVE